MCACWGQAQAQAPCYGRIQGRHIILYVGPTGAAQRLLCDVSLVLMLRDGAVLGQLETDVASVFGDAKSGLVVM